MKNEIDRINRILPNIKDVAGFEPNNRTAAIQNWLKTVSSRVEHYKSKHYALLKTNMVLLELALWKAKLQEVEDEKLSSSDFCGLWQEKMTFLELKAKVDEKLAAARQAGRANCAANIIIPLVLPFLNNDDVFPLLEYDLAILRDWINS